MFRLSRNKPAKSGDSVDFKFSSFKALQVPKGWDKLCVYMISVETGKTIAKSSKAVVQNGSCQWTDTLSASIWLPQNGNWKELDDYLFKFAVALGSGRSGILGEAIINMTGYISSSDLVSASLPLKKNTNGTTLQVTIHCLTPRTKLRDGDSKETNSNSNVEDVKLDYHDLDVKSDMSDSIHAQSVRSSSSKDTSSAVSATHTGEAESRDTSFSVSGSHYSDDSAEGFVSREVFSPTINLSSNGLNPRRDSTSSYRNYPVQDASQSQHSYFNSRRSGSGNHSQNNWRDHSTSPLRVSGSSKILLEAAEDAIEEIRAEAKMWERNARKLMLDLDILRKEFSDQSKNNADIDMKLSEACEERDGLRKEVERLTLLLEMPSSQDSTHLQKELNDEIKFLRESNANLAMQLKRSQESNIEFVSLLQEMELEKSMIQSKSDDLEKSVQEKMEENKDMTIQWQRVKESEKDLQVKVQTLEAKLSESVKESHAAEMNAANLSKEVESLKVKMEELERDCNELTDENLDLLIKLKEGNNKSTEASEQKVQCYSQEVNINKNVLRKTEDGYDSSIQELKNLKTEFELKVIELGTELNNKRSEMAKLEASLVSKEEAISVLRESQTKLEAKVAGLEKEKVHLEETVKAVAKENDIAPKSLNSLQDDLMVLSRNVGTSGKSEVQLRLSELEEENVQLLECISSLEAQLKHLTDESETGRLELEHSKSLADNLQDEIIRLRKGKENQKAGLKQKLQYMQSRWSEFEEEFEHLRRANPHLRATIENLVEERSSLLKLNEELREQNVELGENCTKLEARLMESNKRVSECSKKAEILEENLSSMMKDIASKEKSLASELDALLEENRTHKEQLIHEKSLLNELYLEKTLEVENLQQEVQHLSKKISATRDERDRAINNAMHEVSCLREDNGKLQTSLQEVESKLRWTENELNIVHMESDEKLEGLRAELSASKENQVMLIANQEKVKNLLENYRSSEENLKTAVIGLEYERLQLQEETARLKVQLQKIELLEDEVISLKNELTAAKFEKEKLEALSRVLSEECEELKEEKFLLVKKISTLETAVSEFEECKEKLKHLESDLNRISRTNNQFQRKIQQLEKDKDEHIAKSHSLEEELKLMKEEKQNQKESTGIRVHTSSKTNAKVSPVREDMKFSKTEMMKSTNLHRDNKRRPSLKNDQAPELVRDRQKPSNTQHHKEGDNGSKIHSQHPQTVDVDSSPKIQFLENELSKAIEAANTYKAQLHRLMSEDLSSHLEGDVVPKERFECTKSSLEAELKELRERYSHMSLQYAEVEAERQELVMKLKATNNGKRWFP